MLNNVFIKQKYYILHFILLNISELVQNMLLADEHQNGTIKCCY